MMGAATSRDENRWLCEGVAEYIGEWPTPATKSAKVDKTCAAWIRKQR
ncbi:hypothetical protein Ari01nite_69040 [Paractinoplanes rishiriensis]|uniref:Uncharacterized protein n=1 Tax=Paractinoplanes rishiriensis TaxID=1050105 RepID=A0A919K659_9ACTN|nr:hypothetical protein Ari01nite_69040 [Actinoplanes rishiriensis]